MHSARDTLDYLVKTKHHPDLRPRFHLGDHIEVSRPNVRLVDADNWYDLGDSAIDLWSPDYKSIYDPCPPGWRVPDGGADGIWAKALGGTSYDFDTSGIGFNFWEILGDEESIFYPLTSYYSNVSTADSHIATYLCAPGKVGRYWSCGRDDWGWSTPAVFEISADGKVSCSATVHSTAMGYPVRCMKDN